MRPCDQLQFDDNRERVACPNEGVVEIGGYWFCRGHEAEAHDAYQDYLSLPDS